jgi:hypothetical protein
MGDNKVSSLPQKLYALKNGSMHLISKNILTKQVIKIGKLLDDFPPFMENTLCTY